MAKVQGRAILRIEVDGMMLDTVDVAEFWLDIRQGTRVIPCERVGCTVGNVPGHGIHREYDGTGEVVFRAPMPREQLPQWRAGAGEA